MRYNTLAKIEHGGELLDRCVAHRHEVDLGRQQLTMLHAMCAATHLRKCCDTLPISSPHLREGVPLHTSAAEHLYERLGEVATANYHYTFHAYLFGDCVVAEEGLRPISMISWLSGEAARCSSMRRRS